MLETSENTLSIQNTSRFWFTVVVYFSSPPPLVWQKKIAGVKLRVGGTKVHNHGKWAHIQVWNSKYDLLQDLKYEFLSKQIKASNFNSKKPKHFGNMPNLKSSCVTIVRIIVGLFLKNQPSNCLKHKFFTVHVDLRILKKKCSSYFVNCFHT